MPPQPWPDDPNGSMIPILEASMEEAKKRHPSSRPGGPGVLLNAADRCDRCSAAAAYIVHREDIGDLMFCLHHWRKHFPSMSPQGWVVVGGNPSLFAELQQETLRTR